MPDELIVSFAVVRLLNIKFVLSNVRSKWMNTQYYICGLIR